MDYLAKLKRFLPLVGLVLILPLLVGAVKLQQRFFPQATTPPSPSVMVQISPGAIRNPPLQKPVYLSAQAIFNDYQPLSSNVVYEWGLSSTGSLGLLKPNPDNTAIATYLPTGIGSGDLWVKATTSYGIGIGTARICQGTRCEPVYWSTDNIIVTANDFYFIAGNEKFLGLPDPGTSLSHVSTSPASNSAEFRARWTEHGKPIGLQLFFTRDYLNWWVSGYSISIDKLGQVSLSNQKEFIQPLGTPIRISHKFLPPPPTLIQEIYVDNLYLQAFLPVTSPTPIPTSVPNHSPTITTAGLVGASVGDTYNVPVSGTDPDPGDTLTLNIADLPPGLAPGPCAQTVPSPSTSPQIFCSINGSPTTAGSYQVAVSLTDNHGGLDREVFPLTISPTSDPELACTTSGGTWREFPDSCADTCSPSQPRICLTVATPSCDCGPKACWSGTACIPNPPTPTPTPTPTPPPPPPPPNTPPIIITTALPAGRVSKKYSATIQGLDLDTPTQLLTLSASNLPPGLSQPTCRIRRKYFIFGPPLLQCQIQGKSTQSGTWPVLFTLSDESNITSKTLPLVIR